MSNKRLHILSEVILAFFKLGLTAFGGPSAHIAYFRAEFVSKRQWLSEEAFAQLLAACQFLPGPASSQLGFAIGLHRAGGLGAIAAFVSFTLPSVVLLMLFIRYLPALPISLTSVILHSLKLVAVVVVADAVLKMAVSFCQTWLTKVIAVLAMLVTLLIHVPYQQLYLIVLAGIAAALLSREDHIKPPQPILHVAYSAKLAWVLLVIFSTLLILSVVPIHSNEMGLAAIGQIFYQAGALVFGGGHVVLPLLTEATVDAQLISEADFLAGYGAVQALPGPLFSFAAFLGSELMHSKGVHFAAAIVATIAIFLPGFLLLTGMLPFWQRLMQLRYAQTAVNGVNAAVVGLLAATWLTPLLLSSSTSIKDGAIVLAGFICLYFWRKPVILVIGLIVLLNVLFSLQAQLPW